METSGFMAQIYDILDESHYDNDALKWIVKECKLYYNEYKKPITLDVFKVKVNDINKCAVEHILITINQIRTTKPPNHKYCYIDI